MDVSGVEFLSFTAVLIGTYACAIAVLVGASTEKRPLLLGVVAVVGVGVAALVFPGGTGEKAWMAVALSVVGLAVWVLFASRSALRR